MPCTILVTCKLLGRLRQENCLNPGGEGCSELRSRHCTPVWVTEVAEVPPTVTAVPGEQEKLGVSLKAPVVISREQLYDVGTIIALTLQMSKGEDVGTWPGTVAHTCNPSTLGGQATREAEAGELLDPGRRRLQCPWKLPSYPQLIRVAFHKAIFNRDKDQRVFSMLRNVNFFQPPSQRKTLGGCDSDAPYDTKHFPPYFQRNKHHLTLFILKMGVGRKKYFKEVCGMSAPKLVHKHLLSICCGQGLGKRGKRAFQKGTRYSTDLQGSKIWPGIVAHTCNPSTLGGRGRRITSLANMLLRRLRQENHLNPGGRGCSELSALLHSSLGNKSKTQSQKKKKIWFHHDGQAGLELLTSGDPPTSASQSARITGVSRHARPFLLFYLFPKTPNTRFLQSRFLWSLQADLEQ
ncbi:hypothetical protein AAY473_000295 [Plecturocebus cupreus]